MNWFELVNKATSYIENHITDEIVLENIAKHCNVSYHYFTRTFSLVTGYTLQEYIRNRKITLASYEVSNTHNRILDIAIKYGYSSNEAFSRAFKKTHGLNPSAARKNNVTVYTHFPVLHYDIPQSNIISLQYDILHNINETYIGTTEHIIENNYDETQAYQLTLVHHFEKSHHQDTTLYRIHYNLLYDEPPQYDYFIGYKKDKQDSNDQFELQITAPKVVRFISKHTTKELIPKIKTIIYDEWQKNKFALDGICEIEYTTTNPDQSIDFHYIVSIK